MEEFDDLVQQPDESGVLDLSHRAWVTLDDQIWTWGTTLVVLNASFNNVEVLPDGVGELQLLRELDISCNRIEELPSAIGNCLRLRKLKANGNRMRTIPAEIESCKLLEELYLSENQITHLPEEVGKLAVLRILHLQNNNLRELPPDLGGCLAVDEIDMTNNDDCVNIPKELFRDTNLILWLCRHNKKHRDQIDALEDANEELEDMAKLTEEDKVRLRDDIDDLKAENAQLLAERPKYYLKLKDALNTYGSKICTVS